MALRFKQFLGLLIFFSMCSVAFAEQLSAKLNTQLELLSSCMINNQFVSDETSSIDLGQLDFGETTAGFNTVIETSLSNGGSSGLSIQCSGNSSINVTFGAGANDNKVPSAFTAHFFRAVSNGKDYIAYNLLYGQDNQILKPNQTIRLNNNGQAQSLRLIAQAVNNGRVVSLGSYTDKIPVTIEF